MTEHQIPMTELLVQYEVPNFDSGLTQVEADKRLETYGLGLGMVAGKPLLVLLLLHALHKYSLDLRLCRRTSKTSLRLHTEHLVPLP